jgi:amino acid transporter
MIGSGIFVLPGLAFELGGPSVILAFVLAGLIVLPAALAQAEMATAMPRAGGAYLYIDMAMGPLMGTVAGFGVWFSLVFKSAFALDGVGLYLALFTNIELHTVDLVLGAILVVINLIGIKESGVVQAALVSVVFVILLTFVGGGATFVDSSLYHPFSPGGVGGLLATTALVFVSYAGVTKVASLAEEVANPARTLPVAIVSSLLVMMFVYPAVTYVMVGVTPAETLSGDLTPLATASAHVFDGWVVSAIEIVGVLALASMANAGLLASSRYPFAMARRRLAPSILTRIGRRSGTPGLSIALTGVVLLALVAFVPVVEVAKLASAFQALVLGLICMAHIAFRSAGLWWYRPKFKAPGYPVLDIAGAAACLLLITQLGVEAIVGAVVIIVGGLIWYQAYGRSRALKESAFRESVREQGMSRLLQLTDESLADESRRVMVVSGSDADDTWMLRVARAVGGKAPGSDPTRLVEPAGLDTQVSDYKPDLLVSTLVRDHGDLLPPDTDAAFVAGAPGQPIGTIAVLGSGGPFDVLKISIAARLAEAEQATLRFVHVLDPSSTRAQVRSLERFHAELGELCSVPTESTVIESEDLLAALASGVGNADLAVVGSSRGHHLFTDLIDRIVERMRVPVLVVRVAEREEPRTLRSVLDRVLTGTFVRSALRRKT